MFGNKEKRKKEKSKLITVPEIKCSPSRVFGGEMYHLHSIHFDRLEARRIAKQMKDAGQIIRFNIVSKGVYCCLYILQE
jgi:hypothetical protein